MRKKISTNTSFKNKVTHKLFIYKSYIKMDLALNNPQGLICHKPQPTNYLTYIYKGMKDSN